MSLLSNFFSGVGLYAALPSMSGNHCCWLYMVSSGLLTFLTHCVSNHSGEHPFAFALLSLIASIKRDLTGIELINLNSLEGFRSRRIYFCPEAGLEPAIALLLGKCLNHLNYSGSKNCCSRLIRWYGWWDLNPTVTGLKVRGLNQLSYTLIFR